LEGWLRGHCALARAIWQIATLTKRRRSQHAVSHLSGAREKGGLRVRCAECGAENAAAVRFCVRCDAPVAAQRPVITDEAADVVSDNAGRAGSAATAATNKGQMAPGPYVPGRGDKVPVQIRRARRGYTRMAWSAVFSGWAFVMIAGYFLD